nr:unnamed protein product [Digitaria exilis]
MDSSSRPCGEDQHDGRRWPIAAPELRVAVDERDNEGDKLFFDSATRGRPDLARGHLWPATHSPSALRPCSFGCYASHRPP